MATPLINSPYLIGTGPESFGGNRRAEGDGYSGVIVANTLGPWRFPGAKPREDRKTGRKSTYPPYSLFARLTILADEDSPFGSTEDVEMIQAGYLGSSIPTDDGENPKGATYDQYKLLDAGEAEIGEGEEEDLNAVYVIGFAGGKPRKNYKLPQSDYAQLLWTINEQLKNATEDELRAHGWNGWTPNHDCIVGLHLHFNLLSRDDKMGNRRPTENKDPNAPKTDFKVLCATALLDPVDTGKAHTESVSVAVSSASSAGKGKAGKSTTTTTSKANGAESASDLETAVQDFVMTQILTLPSLEKEPTHGNIMAALPPAFQGGDMAKAITLMNSPWSKDAARPWVRKATGYELKES